MFTPWLCVFFGGGLGALLRYAMLRATAPIVAGLAFPWTILFVNVSGSFLLGLLLGFSTPHQAHSNWRLFAATGVLGGYTTFSTLSTDTMALLQAHKPVLALANAAGSMTLGLACAFLGWMLAAKIRA